MIWKHPAPHRAYVALPLATVALTACLGGEGDDGPTALSGTDAGAGGVAPPAGGSTGGGLPWGTG